MLTHLPAEHHLLTKERPQRAFPSTSSGDPNEIAALEASLLDLKLRADAERACIAGGREVPAAFAGAGEAYDETVRTIEDIRQRKLDSAFLSALTAYEAANEQARIANVKVAEIQAAIDALGPDVAKTYARLQAFKLSDAFTLAQGQEYHANSYDWRVGPTGEKRVDVEFVASVARANYEPKEIEQLVEYERLVTERAQVNAGQSGPACARLRDLEQRFPALRLMELSR